MSDFTAFPTVLQVHEALGDSEVVPGPGRHGGHRVRLLNRELQAASVGDRRHHELGEGEVPAAAQGTVCRRVGWWWGIGAASEARSGFVRGMRSKS